MTDASEGESESTWARLSRRKVVQWGIAYAAGAWGLLQGLQFLVEAFEWPSNVLRLATVLFALGLPVALVLAWYHGDRGEQKVTRVELAIVTLLFLVGGGLFWRYHEASEPQLATTAAPASSERKVLASVAVLPFSNLSSDPANAYLADGIAETLITMLAQVPKLLVIGKVSSFSYEGQEVDPRTIGQQLGVGALLEGSVQRAGDRLRVAVQLVSTDDGGHLWAGTYDRPATDVFAVQDEIATRVTEALSVALSGRSGPGSIGTTNVAAYDAYLRGKQLVDTRETTAMQEGVVLLEKAVAADPNFVRAWIGLAAAYEAAARFPGGNPWGYMPEEQAMSLSKRAAMRAVEIAPDSGLAEVRLARTLSILGTEGVAEHYERAMVLSPDDPEVIRGYVNYLRDADRSGEALKLLEPVLAVEPRDPQLRSTYAMLLDASGDVPGSLRQFREAIRLKPDNVVPYLYAAITAERSVDGADLSLRLYRHAASLDTENANLFSSLSLLYRRLGEEQLALRAERELQRLGATGDLRWSRIYAATVARRPEEARMLAEQIHRESPQDVLFLSRYPGTPEVYRAVLASTTEQMTTHPQWAGGMADAQICLNIWLGDKTAALDALARWEPVWRSRHAFGILISLARIDYLARSLACVGRKDDALTELEALVSEGYNIDWHGMAIDPAYDAIRTDPRFKAVSDKLQAGDAAARKRFLARPDLNDADIESLGM